MKRKSNKNISKKLIKKFEMSLTLLMHLRLTQSFNYYLTIKLLNYLKIDVYIKL